MNEINSNTAVARRLATAMSNGARLLAPSRTTAYIERMIVEQTDRWLQPLITSLMKDSRNTQSAASDFKVLKTRISDIFHSNTR